MIGKFDRFEQDPDGNYLVRFIPVGELPPGLCKMNGAKGSIDIYGIFASDDAEPVYYASPLNYDELLDQMGATGDYSAFKDMIGFWMEENGLLDGEWHRIHIYHQVYADDKTPEEFVEMMRGDLH